MNKLFRIAVLVFVIFLFPRGSVSSAKPEERKALEPLLQSTSCPAVQNTPRFTIIWGDVSQDGSQAPVGSIVIARSPRGDIVGCQQVTTLGKYPAMYVYGEDTSVVPAIPGMRSGETIEFLVNNVIASPSPAQTWTPDKDIHQVNIAAAGLPVPSPDFSVNPANGGAPLAVQFTDLSTGGVSSWLWSFGDGTADSTMQNPTHTYANPGNYTVKLKVSGPTGLNWLTRTNAVEVYAPPQALFTPVAPISGYIPFSVTFTNTSTNFTTSTWSFGDGGTSTDTNPTHIYQTAGVYTVSLTVTGPGGNNTRTTTDLITVVNPVTADFTASPTQGSAPLPVSFTNTTQSFVPVTGYLWDFGDGSTSTDSNPTHMYSIPGTYDVSLTVYVDGAQDSETKSGLITVSQSEIISLDGFESGDLSKWSTSVTDSGDLSITTGAAMKGTYGLQAVIDDNTSIYVVDDSPNAEKHYRARFYFDPNSITMASGDSNTLFIGYAGSYTAMLTMELRYYNGTYQLRPGTLLDSGSFVYAGWVTISDAPHFVELDWQAASAAGGNNGKLDWWIDGGAKTGLAALDNDTRQIDRVRLGAAANLDTGTRGTYYFDAFESRRSTYIGLEGVLADFSATPTQGRAPMVVAFTNLSQPNDPANSYAWDFGDGATSTEANPSHTYSTYGSYTVSLTVTSPRGQDTKVKASYIQMPELIFADGFESGNLTKWSSSVTDAGDLSVTSGSAMIGSYGLQAVIDDNTSIYVVDDSPIAEKRYRARFYFDPNSITMAAGDANTLFIGYAGSTTTVLVIEFRYYGGSYQLRPGTLVDGGTFSYAAWVTISDARHFVELDWQAASAAGGNNGKVDWWIDGGAKTGLAALDNDTRQIDRVRLGAAANLDTGTRGTYYFDSFESRSASYIGMEVLADFSASPIEGIAPLLVNFTNLSQPDDPANSFVWDFGDGATSTEKNPSHTYNTPGNFTVILTTIGPDGRDSETKVDYIQVARPIFANGFENGSLVGWSSSVTDSGDLSVTTAAAMKGAYGLQAVIDDNVSIYVVDDSPLAEKRYQARFYFDPNSIVMASGDSHTLFIGYSGSYTSVLVVEFRYYNASYQLRLGTISDTGVWTYGGWCDISDQSHLIEFGWRAAASDGANNGSFSLWIDGGVKSTAAGLDNDTRQIDRIRLGAAANLDTGTRGTYYFDAFASRNFAYIGPEGVLAEFSTNVTQGRPPFLVSFTNNSQPVDPLNTYLWDFGDGATSTEASPSHTYTGYGNFTVSLTVTGPKGVDTETKINYIQVPERIFGDGFESGGLTTWSSSVTGGGDLSVSNSAALIGSYGLQVVINDKTSIYVLDESPLAEKRYRARFYFDPNTITMAAGDSHTMFIGYAGKTTSVLFVELRCLAGIYQVRIGTVKDSNSLLYTAWSPILDARNFIEFDWKAATGTGANNGALSWWINGVLMTGLSGIDNDTRQIDRVRLGAAANLDAGTSGTYYFDDFQSRRESYIGPAE